MRGNPVRWRKPATDQRVSSGESAGNDELVSPVVSALPVGLALLDRNLKYQSVNRALAQMNRIPVDEHKGASLKNVVGPATSLIEPMLVKVFETSKSLFNVSISSRLAKRQETGHWMATYLPIFDPRKNNVTAVAAVVFEVTESRKLQRGLNDVLSRLDRTRQLICDEARVSHSACQAPHGSARDLILRHLDTAISDAQGIAKTLGAFHPADCDAAIRIGADPQLPPALGGALLPPVPGDELSRREQEVLQCLADGQNNKQVAAELNISVRTVETHRAHILGKLRLHSIGELIRYAIRNQLVQP